MILSLADGTTRELPGSGGTLRWTPDSRALWMAAGTWPDQVRLVRVPVDGGERVAGPRLPSGWGITLSPDGTRVSLFTYPDGVGTPTAPPAREVWALDGIVEALAGR